MNWSVSLYIYIITKSIVLHSPKTYFFDSRLFKVHGFPLLLCYYIKLGLVSKSLDLLMINYFIFI